MNYLELYKEHKGLLSLKWVHYTFIYQELLEPFLIKNKPVNILEIGVLNGGSLEIWKKFLPEGSKIYGIDIDPNCKNIKFSENIYFNLCSASDKKNIDEVFENIKFDIILDDGSHISKDVIDTFNLLFIDKLNPGGIYIIEDLQTSYWKNLGGKFRGKNTSMEFLKNKIDALFVNHFGKTPFYYKKEINELRNLHQYIKRISFYENICAIEKYNVLKAKQFSPIYTGEIADVEEWTLKNVKNINELNHEVSATKNMFLK